MKAYKLCRIKNNKLYPLFVDTKNELEMNVWLEAKEQEKTEGKVKSKIGKLSFRPGFHSCKQPFAKHIGKKSDPKLKKPDLRPKDQVWVEIEISDTNKYRQDYKKHKMIPFDGYYEFIYQKNVWYISHKIKILKILTESEVKTINKGNQDLKGE